MGIINKPLFSKIATRFGVQQSNTQMLQTSDTLVPVTVADDFMRTSKINVDTVTDTDGTLYLEVPKGKRWYLKGCDGWRTNSGTMYLYLYALISGVWKTHNISDPNPTAGATYIRYDPGVPIILEEGWSVNCTFGAGISGTLGISLVYEEEDIA